MTYGAVSNLYFVTHRNISADIHLSEDDTLKALVTGKIKAAMLWQPTITAYLAAHAGAPFTTHPLAEPHARWNIVALYAPKSASAAASFQAAMAADPTPRKAERTNTRFGYRAPHYAIQLAAAVTGGADGSSSDVPALYTTAQANAGAGKYSDNCAQCHGAKLEGQAGPALRGPLFASVKTGFSVGDILTFMVVNMPATQPGSLSHDDYTDIMAFVLAQNGYPAGPTALNFDTGQQSKIPLLFHGK